jgi:hypothetical protein
MATTPYVRNLDPLRGLKCPVCDYELTGLPSSVCPECGSRYKDALAVRTAARRKGYWRACAIGSAISTLLIVFLCISDAHIIARNTNSRCGTASAMAMTEHLVGLPLLLMIPLYSWLKCRSDPFYGFLTRWFLGAGFTAWIGVPAIITLFNVFHPW